MVTLPHTSISHPFIATSDLVKRLAFFVGFVAGFLFIGFLSAGLLTPIGSLLFRLMIIAGDLSSLPIFQWMSLA